MRDEHAAVLAGQLAQPLGEARLERGDGAARQIGIIDALTRERDQLRQAVRGSDRVGRQAVTDKPDTTRVDGRIDWWHRRGIARGWISHRSPRNTAED